MVVFVATFEDGDWPKVVGLHASETKAREQVIVLMAAANVANAPVFPDDASMYFDNVVWSASFEKGDDWVFGMVQSFVVED